MKNNYPTLEECYEVITKALQVLGVHYSPDHLPYHLLVPQIESLQRGYDRGITRINDLEHLIDVMSLCTEEKIPNKDLN